MLTARDLDPDGELVRVCVHCACQIEPGAIEWVGANSLVAHGYDLPGRSDPHAERGCRDGACGVHQPD